MADKFSPDLLSTPSEKIFYTLTMFPYPSGIGLHAGHASIFTINDVIARYKRAQGYIVFNPFGFDAFGLPTENYALQTQKGAREVTDENKAHFLDQLKALNLSFDYERIVDTSMPDYYHWTQWIFIKLYEAGLVYRAEKFVNRCPHDQTVLANDQVVDGRCERCKSEVIQKKVAQRFIKITDYADKLIEDLDLVDRPEETKVSQKNWIGRSEGAEIDFSIQEETITIFTTRPDTLYGVTALVLAPENTLLDELLDENHSQNVQEYRNKVLSKTTIQRQQDVVEKTGVFSGLYATHPLSGKQIPLRYADYVLMEYGSGAVMMVPAHDERDFLFWKSNQNKEGMLAPQRVIDVGTHIVPEGEEVGRVTDHFTKNIYKRDSLPSVLCSQGNSTKEPPTLINSEKFNGSSIAQAQQEILQELEQLGVGRQKITYRLRDWSVSRQRYRGCPIPMYHDAEHNYSPIPESELPVILPLDLKDFKPQGKSPLEDHPTFKYYKNDGQEHLRECDTLDTFMDSSFYFLRFPDAHNDKELIRQELAKKVLPVDIYTGGKEHTVGHLLYSRFIHKFLYDQGYVSTPEPFMKLIHQGMVLGADGRKMGKRYNNGVDPLEVVERVGSDAARTYLMFMGPIELDKARNDNALNGVKKFLDRVERITHQKWYGNYSDKVTAKLHETIRDITHDLDHLKFNTAVSKLMILNNTVYEEEALEVKQLASFAQMLAPFAPQLAARLWKLSGQEDDIDFALWPQFDESKITSQRIDFPIQINGKMRGTLSVHPTITEDDLLELIRSEESLHKYLTGEIKKVIFIPQKIINIISN